MKIFLLLAVTVSLVFGVVDINNASAKELTTLKGVGPKRAAAIIAYREQHCFKRVDEITRIKGLATKFLQKNRDNMKAGACE